MPVAMCLTPEGRLLFSMFEFRPASITMDVWEIKVDTATGKPLSEGRRITQWSTFASGQLDDVNATADGKSLASISTVLEIEGFAGPTILGWRGPLAFRPSGVRDIQY